MPRNIFDVADSHRRALLRQERAAAREMARAYEVAWRSIRADLEKLLAQLEQARRQGLVPDAFQPRQLGGPPTPRTPGTFSPSWLFQEQRLQSLQRQVEAEIARFSRIAEEIITEQQAGVIQMAQEHAERLGLLALGEIPDSITIAWDRLPREALTDLVGFMQDGSPLRDLLEELGPDASQAVRDGLIRGVGMGLNPRRIAQEIRGALGGNLTRALRISRTEVLRAYRESTRRNYQANGNVVGGWIWHSARDKRTCAACWAMHGTVHTNQEQLDDHVNGRCAMVPITKTWAEIGQEFGIDLNDAPESRLEIEKGGDLFRRLSPQEQDGILGRAGGAAYRAGAVRLEDFVGRRHDPKWGTMRSARSLRAILGPQEARHWVILAAHDDT